MNKTGIQYLDYTFNPIVMRCTPCSPGCNACWHLKTADRLSNNPMIDAMERDAYSGSIGPRLIQERLDQPLRVKKPSVIGLQFMGDILHESISPEWIDSIIGVMGQCKQHLFMVLTKRPENFEEKVLAFYHNGNRKTFQHGLPDNAWMGFTAENQEWFDRRWEDARKIPGKLWVSAEPLLGQIDFSEALFCSQCNDSPPRFGKGTFDNPLNNAMGGKPWSSCPHCGMGGFPKIHFVAVGPETGPQRRPCDPEWIRSIVEQCTAAGIPVFVKAYPIGTRISADPTEWPEWARRQEMPGKES